MIQELRDHAIRNAIVFGLSPVGLSAMLILEKIGINTVGIDLVKSCMDFATPLGFEKIVDFTETEGLIKMSPNPEGFCGSIETMGRLMCWGQSEL